MNPLVKTLNMWHGHRLSNFNKSLTSVKRVIFNANGLADNCDIIADINGDDLVKDLEDIVTLLW